MAVSEDECILRSFCERMDGSEFSDCVPGLHSNGLVFSFIAVAILVPELIYSFITSPSCLRPELMDWFAFRVSFKLSFNFIIETRMLSLRVLGGVFLFLFFSLLSRVLLITKMFPCVVTKIKRTWWQQQIPTKLSKPKTALKLLFFFFHSHKEVVTVSVLTQT